MGAFAGAVTWGAGQVGGGFFGQALAHGAAGGLTGVVSGGSFKKGFELAVVAYGALQLYKHFVAVNKNTNMWKSGKGVIPKKRGVVAQECLCNNNFGSAHIIGKGAGFLPEGGAFSQIMDSYPGMNALATLHDVWGDLIYKGLGLYPLWANFGTMLPAAAVTYTGLIATPMGSAIAASRRFGDGVP